MNDGYAPQIQKCHDVWANTLDGQIRIVNVETNRMLKTISDVFGRLGQRFCEAAVSLTQFGMEYKKAKRDRLTKTSKKR